jgi:hypothetical protein
MDGCRLADAGPLAYASLISALNYAGRWQLTFLGIGDLTVGA